MPTFTPTSEQEIILQHDCTRHARILAGPGTGKSATLVALTERYLSSEFPPKLRLLTFTRAATSELALKVAQHPHASVARPSTIHSFAISVLLMNPGSGEFPHPLRIADDWEWTRIIRNSLAKLCGTKVQRLDDLIREMASNWESLSQENDSCVTTEERARFLGSWHEHRYIYGYTLLAELPNTLRTALLNHPDLEGVDFDLLVVDEYQDLNACDLEVLHLLATRGCKIIGAGDDDQSIYSFRKADPSGIRNFLSAYTCAADYPLSITLRCGSRIIEWANYIIAGDPSRPAGRPRLTSKPDSPLGEVALLAFAGQSAEAKGIAVIVKNLVEKESVPPSEILILLRGDYNASFSSPIREEIQKVGVKVTNPDEIKQLLALKNNRMFLEVIRLLVNQEDSIAWASLLLLENGIGETFFKYIYERARSNNSSFGTALLRAYAEGFPLASNIPAKRARKLIDETLSWLRTHPMPSTSPAGWGKWIIDSAGGGLVPAPTPELEALLLSLDALVEPNQGLDRFLCQITPLGKDLATSKSEGVRIMTMAGSKGLTVRATIISGAEEGVVPHADADIREERRLLYVSMTRAREYLFMTWARQRRGPTARMGMGRVNQKRNHSLFLNGGPVNSQDGTEFLRARWSSN